LRKYVPTLTADKYGDLIYFDAETTGLSTKDEEIIQMAARCKGLQFEVFVNPDKTIGQKTKDLTGISKNKDSGQMYYRGNAVPSVSFSNAFDYLLEFVKQFQNPILVCHNAKYDVNILANRCKDAEKLELFKSAFPGFVDSLQAARDLVPKGAVKKYSLEKLSEFYLGNIPNDLHSAARDVDVLEQIVGHFAPEKSILHNYSFSLIEYLNFQALCTSAAKLQTLLEVPAMMPAQLTALAEQNISLQDLKDLCSQGSHHFSAQLKKLLTKINDNTLDKLFEVLSKK